MSNNASTEQYLSEWKKFGLSAEAGFEALTKNHSKTIQPSQ